MAALFLLLAIAAALGVALGLLLVASASTTRTRRAHRKRRTAGHDLTRQVAELERENARLQNELARRDQPVRLGDLTSPADLESTASAASTAERRVTVPSHQLAERHSEPLYSEPLYEEAKRAARLRSDPDVFFLSTDDRARVWQTDEYVRRP
jgi:hypothetical protein